jgi:hypothetical protein
LLLIVLDWVCRFTPAIGASVLFVMALIALLVWIGGAIERIKVPPLFDIRLAHPIVFNGSWLMFGLALLALAGAGGLGYVQATHTCASCEGMPGETAWVYAGQFNPQTKKFTQGEFVSSEKAGVPIQNIAAGNWILLKDNLRTMIVDYDKSGTARATDNPFTKGATMNYTCKKLPVGQRLYVVEKQTADPLPGVRHIWLRVRKSPPGVAPTT